MEYLEQSFLVPFNYRVYFTEDLFNPANPLLAEFFSGMAQADEKPRLLIVADQGVVDAMPALGSHIRAYFAGKQVKPVGDILVVPGGEIVKNDDRYVSQIIDAVDRHGIDRHSYVMAIGGGAVLDAAGYAAAIAHRGIRHIRVPTTVLSQNDSGVGVKNGINYRGKKNFLGTFVPPVAVFNDFAFLATLDAKQWRCGIAEAVKVALIKDAAFFGWLEEHAAELAGRDAACMQYLVRRCAALHMEHIRSGDPFEKGSSRPLDFGHWAAHKLEQLTGFELLHGEAVSVGIALDSVYSALSGRISVQDAERIVQVLLACGLPVSHSLLERNEVLLHGLEEFREHLGGRLTIMLLQVIGTGEEVHEMEPALIQKAAEKLLNYSENQSLCNLAETT